MKQFFFLMAGLIAAFPAKADVNVTQHHNNATRDGLYIDSNFTQANAANLSRDTSFDGTIVGNVYAQPLYIENGPGGRAMVIAVTESNNVYALDAVTGSIIWSRTNLGTPFSGTRCGSSNINPIGITGTPVVDLASRSLFFDAMTAPAVNTFRRLIYSLNVDTGVTNAGWPVDVNIAVGGFDSAVQTQRAALSILADKVYVPYGGFFGDCGAYRGRVVGVQMNNPTVVSAYTTASSLSGIWGPGGIANDGTNLFVATGNGPGGATWMGSEAIIRLQPGPIFSGSTVDYWAPNNWASLDAGDVDLGGSGPVVLDVPGATPSALVLAVGKDHIAYLLNRASLGGVAAPVASASIGSSTTIGAACTYRTTNGTYVVVRPSSGTLTAVRITATSPPTIVAAWSVSSSGRTAPFVTTTDGTSNAIVWAAGSDGKLRGYNGDTGATIFTESDTMAGIRSYNTGIVARGRIYYAADNKVYSFRVPPISPILPVNTSRPAAGSFQLSFSSVLGTAFSVYGSPSLANPVATWPRLGSATEVGPGQYQFTDAAAGTQKFYRVTTP
jgi:hypothetical protein